MTALGTARGATRPRAALAALCFGFFIIQLDVTIVNVVLEPIQRDLGGGLTGQQWVVSGYTLALAAGMLLAGEFGDRYGARKVCVTGALIFGFASALCSAAPNIETLVAARVVQGFGAAALLPCSLALIVRQFPDPRERANALGVWGGISSIGMAAGPVLGGLLVPIWGWQSVFWVNVPVCVVAALMIRYFAEESPRRADRKLDMLGAAVGTVALGVLVAGFIETGQRGWTDPVPLSLIVLGLTLGGAFLIVERRMADPLVPLSLFAPRQFSAGTVVGGLQNFCMYGGLLSVSLFLQGPLHRSPTQTAFLILPFVLVVFVGSSTSGRLTARFGPRLPMLFGYGLAAAGSVALAFAGNGTTAGWLAAGFAFTGLASLGMPAMTSVVMAAAPEDRTSLASGVLNTIRQSGGALGAAVLGSLLVLGQRGGMDLSAPMVLAALGYGFAVVASCIATRKG